LIIRSELEKVVLKIIKLAIRFLERLSPGIETKRL
jgi:hypothetical protein